MAKRRIRKTTPSLPPRPKEVTTVAQFPRPWSSDDQEIEVLEARAWHPTTADFGAVAATPNSEGQRTLVYPVANLDDFIGACLGGALPEKQHPKGSVIRINLISHGVPGLIALGGRVLENGDCELGRASSTTPLESQGIDERLIEWFETDEIGQQYRDMIRAKLHPQAELWLILCNAGKVGLGEVLARRIASAFQVTVRAYPQAIMYWPRYDVAPADPKAPRRIHQRNITSIGHGQRGAGYACWEKVAPELAGAHLRGASRFAPAPVAPAPDAAPAPGARP